MFPLSGTFYLIFDVYDRVFKGADSYFSVLSELPRFTMKGLCLYDGGRYYFKLCFRNVQYYVLASHGTASVYVM